MKIVAKQYEKHVYPKPISDLEKSKIIMGSDLHNNRFLYWPNLKEVPKNIRLLIAGCGTNQAAYYAYRYPEIEVTGIDISKSSLQHEMYLKDKHNLKNLRLEHLNLLDVGELKEGFDMVISTGVLHHIENPEAGLSALESVLYDEGVMSLMVYGKYLRLGVYLLQEVFRDIGASKQSSEDITLVKETINSLNENHVLRRYLNIANDLGYDSGIVDTFLHPQDRAYSVKEIMEFVNSSDLDFYSWLDRGYYIYDATLNKNLSLSKRMNKLDQTQKWIIAEKLNQNIGTHSFVVRKKINKIRRIEDIYFSNDWKELIPDIKVGTHLLPSSDNNAFVLKRLGRSIRMGEIANNFLNSIDGNSSVDDLMLKNQIKDEKSLKDFIWAHYELGNIEFSTYKLS